jgi:hypothetical protein
VDSEIIGYSVRGRPLVVHFRGRPRRPRVLILAGQHGDEVHARTAASVCAATPQSLRLDAVEFAIIADANPDGAAAGTRRNALRVDLNRDHLLLRSPETLAVHSFVRRWHPHLIIDVHTYRPWCPQLLRYDLMFSQDVMIDVPTNPAVRAGWSARAGDELLEFVTCRMAQASLRSARYTLVKSGIVRHSTLDIADARNGLALRYGIPTVLLEGRRSFPGDSPIFAAPEMALQRSIEAVVEWAHQRAELSPQSPEPSSAPDFVPVCCHNVGTSLPRRMDMYSVQSGEIQVVDVPGDYLPDVHVTRMIRAPRAYGVPRHCVELLTVLDRHGFETADRTPAGNTADQAPGDGDELVLFPTDQAGGRMLSLFLDADSQFAAHRFPELELPQPYPIVRVD